MLPHEHRLRTRHDITSAIRRGRRRTSTLLVVHIAFGDRPGPARAAFAVSSAIGNSVVRHRLTRQLRAALTPLLLRLPLGTDVVVRALPPARGAGYPDLVASLEHCLHHDLVTQEDLIAPEVKDEPPSTPTEARESVAPQPESTLLTGAETPAETPVAPTTPAAPRSGISRLLYLFGTPLRLLLIGLVTVYRQVISPVLPPTCRYHPSCSAYALESLQVHGAAKGVVLAGWRLGRCNPFSKGGLDPVPERGSWRPDIHPDGTPRADAAHPDGAVHPARAVGWPDNRGALTPARSPEA